MSYDDEFFRLYADYLKEPRVRDKHDEALDWAHGYLPNGPLVELGCGLGEFYDYDQAFFPKRQWTGVDTKCRREDFRSNIIEGDYTNIHSWMLPLYERGARPNSFVSLFSTECCMPDDRRHYFYDSLFANIPLLSVGVTAGFYYNGLKDKPQVEENGNVVSWQTIDRLGDRESLWFEERRLILPVPSTMFGEDVYEVWKVMIRR